MTTSQVAEAIAAATHALALWVGEAEHLDAEGFRVIGQVAKGEILAEALRALIEAASVAGDDADSDQVEDYAPVSARLFEATTAEPSADLLGRALALGKADRAGGASEKWGGAVWATLTGGSAAECPGAVAAALGDTYRAGFYGSEF